MFSFLPFCGGGSLSDDCSGSLSDELELMSRSLDENFLRRLQTLTTPSISSSWLSLAVEFLKSTHLEARDLISNLKSNSSDSRWPLSSDQIVLYMSQSHKLFRFFNAILCELDVLYNQCIRNDMILVFALQLLSEGGQMSVPEKLRKVRDYLAKLNNKSRGSAPPRFLKDLDLGVLIGDLVTALRRPPRGKISDAGKLISRTLYAVGLATVFVAGVVASSVYGLTDIGGVEAPEEFMWAETFNDLQSAMCDEMKKRRLYLVDVDDLEARVVGVRDLFDGALSRGSNEEVVRLMSAVNLLKTVTAEVSIGLESLIKNIEGLCSMFHNTLDGEWAFN